MDGMENKAMPEDTRNLPDVVTKLVHGSAFIPHLSYLQKAFSLSAKLMSDYDVPDRERKYFRMINHLIWRSCGGSK